VTLAFAAACTSRIRLGTNALVAPWYRPVTLARSLAALDVVSGGRLTVGLGVAAPDEEYDALGLPRRRLGERQDDLLEVLEAVWPPGPAEGDRGVEHRAVRAPVCRQVPRPPILLATGTAGGLDRIARRADGWLAAGVPIDALRPLWSTVCDRAALHGRDAAALQLVVRADVVLCDEPVAGARAPYHGSLDQVVGDLVATELAGADEVVLSAPADLALEEAVHTCQRVVEALAPRPGVAA
jgi:alkanesulfonate monooxygenase SsuD/methylene tetrahydromethanopterin reductase-like flavin-dependent oxidoreductase (luciferase family)